MRIDRFSHAGLEAGDLTLTEAFYREVCGLREVTRFAEDDEVLLGVGAGDHLLLRGNRAGAGRSAGGGLHHLAFELPEGHRGLAQARQTLARCGVAWEEAQHGADGALYLHDPAGNLVELCVAAGSTRSFTRAGDRLAAARRFLDGHARLVDRALFEHCFEGAGPQRLLAALEPYRNGDGGFGHALEPDVRAAASAPLHTITALELLREAGVRAAELARSCCDYFARVADGVALPALFADARTAPMAEHWNGPWALQPGLGWTMGAAAALLWHGVEHPWLRRAVDVCRAGFDDLAGEAHQLAYGARFAAALPAEEAVKAAARLAAALPGAANWAGATPVLSYGVTPLQFAPAPDALMAGAIGEELIAAHLDDLLDAQLGDGGWPIRFAPAPGCAALEWRGRCTVEALITLRAYGRI